MKLRGENKMTTNGASIQYASVIGTDKDDTILGTSGPNFINGRGGDDVIQGNGGGDILIGASGTDYFVYTTTAQPDIDQKPNAGPKPDAHSKPAISEDATYNNEVDTILDFSRSEGDRIDLSDFSANIPGKLTFSGATPKAYAVYYSEGIASPYDIVTGTSFAWFIEGNGITLMADLDGDSQNGPELTVAVWGWAGETLDDMKASDLIL